jgi:uncharacterized Fe-S cluster-containing radical SAM superfamily protein
MHVFDPIARAQEIRSHVERSASRKYYRVPRPGSWYGGIATADCCGCNLKCIFCWSNKPRDNPDTIGHFYTPEQVFNKIIACAARHGYRLLRLSGNEPTLCREHLFALLGLVDTTNYLFILETNGTLLDVDYITALARFKNLHVRVSLKGTNPEEHSLLTGATGDSFEAIIDAIALLKKHNVRFNVAAMLSFSPDKNITLLKGRLQTIDRSVAEGFEEEYVFLYPHVVRRLQRSGLKPFRAYSPRGIPQELK